MRRFLLSFFLGLTSTVSINAQSLYFPPISGNTWDTISPASLGWCLDKIDTLIDYLGDRNTKAFILLKDGKIVIEKYYGTFTQDSNWYWASAGKTLTAFTVGMAQQESFISISDTTSAYLGTGWTICPPAKEDMITIRHQLTMTSGLDDGVPDYTCTLDTCLQYLADAGTRWAYHNGPYTLLDGVIQAATGQSLNAYFTAKVKTPTGMNGAFLPSGYNNVYYSKPRSMARFGLLMLNNGNWNGNQIMTDASYFNQMVNTSQNINNSYGYLWWLNGKASFMVPTLQFVFPGSLNPSAPNDMIAALGKNGQVINVVPSQNLVYIRMGDPPGDNSPVPISFNDTIWQKLNDAMCTPASVSNAVSEIFDVMVYPNPFTDELIVTSSVFPVHVSLQNIVGETIQNRTLTENGPEASGLVTSNLAEGIYFLVISSGDKRVVKKVVCSKSSD